MPKHKTLLVALAAAGLAGSASAPHAQFANVFVPELAMIDGALCRMPLASGLPLVRLAQAAQDKTNKKTEISPAAPAAANAASGAARLDEPPFLQGLGTRTMKITSSSKRAQQFFDQGYRLAWGFNHDEALRAFRAAQRLDPQCAMCYWAEAWALGPNINVPMEPKAIGPALAAVEHARRLAPQASTRERALIGAIAQRYSPAAGADRSKLDAAYAAAMRQVALDFLRISKIATLYADALMNVSAWDYWEPVADNCARASPISCRPRARAQTRSEPRGCDSLCTSTRSKPPTIPGARRLTQTTGQARAGRRPPRAHACSHLLRRRALQGFAGDERSGPSKSMRAYIAREKPAGVYPSAITRTTCTS
jgi:hypothetical protein